MKEERARSLGRNPAKGGRPLKERTHGSVRARRGGLEGLVGCLSELILLKLALQTVGAEIAI